MKWEILIVTERSRNEMLGQLIDRLSRQVRMLGLNRCSEVGITVHEDQTGMLFGKTAQIGEMREYLRQRSSGRYINFIDSDDLVSPDYVSSIFPLLDGVDQIGFDVRCFSDKDPLGTASHSLQHGKWSQTQLTARTINGRMGDPFKYCRDISHLNPMRRELALQATMSGGIGEDCRWANDLRAKGIVKTEHYIPRVLYWYLWRGNKRDGHDAVDPWRLKLIEELDAADRPASEMGT